MILLLCILVILILIILLLVVPLEIQIMAIAHGRVDFQIKCKCLYFIRWESPAGGSGGKAQKTAGDEGVDFKALSRIYELLQIKGLWDRTWLLIKRLWGRVTISSVYSDLKISLGDDYYTGMLVGLFIPLTIFLNSRFPGRISLEPYFEDQLVLEGLIKSDMRFRPLQALVPCLAFLCSPPVRQARKVLRKSKWKK